MRTTSKRMIGPIGIRLHVPAWGLDMKTFHGIGFELILGEYTAEKVEWRNQWNQSFSARAGIVFNLYK